ncbi:MFS transporter [Desulfospira joergensenii]|uniref:MFS transporter n=1 Tax=Desulfospira joergensenii TaxID=53329 RepID=UPI00041D7505|nr:MFS transporter [Desulfospira joergensenii]
MMKNKNLTLLLSGQLVSQTGDKFYMLALSMMVLETTGSPAKTGLVLFAGLLPVVGAGLFSGVVVDRVNKKTLLIATDLFRGFIVSFVAYQYIQGSLGLGTILTSQVLLGLNSAFFNPTIPSIIPGIVKKENLSKANAGTQFVSGISNILGPAAGGIMVAGTGYFIVFGLNALSFFISAGFESLLKIPSMTSGPRESLGRSLKKGYQFIYGDSRLMNILLMVFVIHFFVGCVEVAIPVIADLLPGKGAANMGAIQAAFGAGSVVMALALSYARINGRESFLLFSAVGMIGCVISLIGISRVLDPNVLFPMLLFGLAGSSIILAGTSFQTLIQNRTEPHMIGRVFGVVSSLGNFSIPFAMLVYGFLFEAFDLRRVMGFSGLLIILTATASFLSYGKREKLAEAKTRSGSPV